ncbi:PQQ-binding-like beta-propeller repeat protein [Streptomyces xanthochromogenes]|uniref:protein kinase domain-containing protein n=1 Tax=Streptomyces xanthochromogenes TaxID=67384 RepID=UPI0034473420
MRVIADRYELVAFVGRGGMGDVWEGRDQVIGRRVAVKLLPDHQHGPAADLFLREARTAGGLNHPGVVTVHDLGRDPRDGTLYLVMEYVSGRNLAVVLREEGPPQLAASVEWAAQIAAALSAAHEAGVVHRDLKPANLMLTSDGKVKVLDFGIARFMAATDKSSQVMGTLAYMAPERFAEHSGDARSDLYAFGCVLHELLTGEPPFTASDPVSLMTAHLNKAPDRPGSLRAGLPAALDALVLRLLAKRPADRPQSAARVRDELRALELSSASMAMPAAPLAPPAAAHPPTYVPSRPEQPPAAHQLPTRTATPFTPGSPPHPADGAAALVPPAPVAVGRRRALWLGLGGAALLAGGTGLTLAVRAVRAGGDGGAGDAKASPKPKVRPWRYDSGMSQGAPAPFAVADGVLYVATDATITALDARTGSKRWDGPLDLSPEPPTAADGTVYAGGSDGLWALDAQGKKKWTFPTEELVDSRPAVTGGTVYFACRDKHMYAVHADAGRKKWSYPLGGNPACPPTLADGTVYIGCDTQDSALYALDAADGSRKWVFRGGVGFQQAPAVSGGLVYATDSGGTLYAFDAANGTKKWSLPHTGETLCLAGDTLFVGSGDALGLVHALDPSTGHKKWTLKKDLSTPHTTRIAVAGGLVFVGRTDPPDGIVHAFDANDGSERWSTSTWTGQSKARLGNDLVTAYGFVYVTTADGVVALDAATGAAP